MGLLPHRTRRQRGELRVVVVQNMSLDAVYQCRMLGGKFGKRAQHCRFTGQFLPAKTAAQK